MKPKMILWASILSAMLFVTACDDEIDVQRAYYFTVETLPVQKRIAVGETAEIRCTLVRDGEYDGTRYTIRYFQPDGRGVLRMDDSEAFIPNDRYPLDKASFRLYYTSHSDGQQVIDVYIEDNMGQMTQKSFSFQNENSESDEDL